MKSINYWDIEDTVESCFEAATTLLDHIPKERNIVTNKNNETFCVRLTDFYTIAKKLFGFTAALRGDGEDYSYMGYTESVLKSILSVEDPKRSFHNPSEEQTKKKDAFQTALNTYYNTATLLRDNLNGGAIITNSKREDVTLTSSHISEIAFDLLGIVVAYRGEAKDYYWFAYTMSNLKVHEKQRISHYERIIHYYQQAVKLGKNDPYAYYRLITNKRKLAGLLSDKQMKESVYLSAIEDGKRIIMMGPKDDYLIDHAYYNRGYSYLKLAPLSEDRNERISQYKRAIANLRKACRVNQDDPNYFYLAEAEKCLAKEFYRVDKDKATKLKQEALANYKIALSIVNDSITREKIQNLEQSLI